MIYTSSALKVAQDKDGQRALGQPTGPPELTTSKQTTHGAA
jgi:hypothetical protein